MRPPFADLLKRNARQWGLQLSETIEFAFRRRYGLPPTDPRWLNATLDDVLIDYWAHAHRDDPNLRNEEAFETEDFEAELAAMAASVKEDDWEDVPA